jgi:tRNA threonylcarbamoyladenosine biosynthesis protein TsaB
MIDTPYILYIEASSDVCSLCLAHGNVILSKREDDGSRAHSSLLATYIKECFEESGIKVSELNATCLSGGPGSYTSLRISAGIVKGLSFGTITPVISVNSLDVYYYGVTNRNDYDVIVSTIDARREDVYIKVFGPEGTVLMDTRALTLNEDILKSFTDLKVLICGNGNIKSAKYFPFAQISEIKSPKAAYMIEPGLQLWQERIFENAVNYVPFYLKPPNITQSTKKYF